MTNAFKGCSPNQVFLGGGCRSYRPYNVCVFEVDYFFLVWSKKTLLCLCMCEQHH